MAPHNKSRNSRADPTQDEGAKRSDANRIHASWEERLRHLLSDALQRATHGVRNQINLALLDDQRR
jgi:hypothetical protein